ncbi:hypothetical protein WMF30_09680 [Sorangium sp. So ce134]
MTTQTSRWKASAGSTRTSGTGRRPAERELAHPDAEAGAHRGELRDVAVAAERIIARRGDEPGGGERVDDGAGAVGADEGVVRHEPRERRRGSVRGEVRLGGEEAELDAPGAAPHQAGLRRLRHAHGDIGVAAQEILGAIRGDELDLKARMSNAERGEHRGKHLGANDLAARDAHGAAVGIGGARHGAHEGARARGDGLGVGQRGKRELGRHQAVRRAGEEHDAELRLELLDLAAHGGLRDVEGTRGGGEAAGAHDGKEGTVEVPRGLGWAHQKMMSGWTHLYNVHEHPQRPCSPRRRHPRRYARRGERP